MTIQKIGWIGISLVALASCKKDKEVINEISPIDISISINHEIDESPLVYNDLIFNNKAGNTYEVTRLEYYLSDFAFLKANGEWYRPNFDPVLIKEENVGQSFYIKNVKQGNYTGISFMVGIPESMNKMGMLENSIDNLNMAWPELLNGGYHFIRFEGNYIDDQKVKRGFTIHMGSSGMQSVNEFINTPMSVNSSSKNAISLTMNLNEWFANPNLYDFNVDGNYTMAVDTLMKKVSENGQHCFTLSVIK